MHKTSWFPKSHGGTLEDHPFIHIYKWIFHDFPGDHPFINGFSRIFHYKPIKKARGYPHDQGANLGRCTEQADASRATKTGSASTEFLKASTKSLPGDQDFYLPKDNSVCSFSKHFYAFHIDDTKMYVHTQTILTYIYICNLYLENSINISKILIDKTCSDPKNWKAIQWFIMKIPGNHFDVIHIFLEPLELYHTTTFDTYVSMHTNGDISNTYKHRNRHHK